MKKSLLLLFAALLPLVASAHDFEVDGIYYNITSEEAKTAEVTYQGDDYWDYDEYSGSITLTATVTHDGVQYSVTSIGICAFEGCSSLTTITCKAVIPPTVSCFPFDGVDKSIPVNVPAGSVDSYKSAAHWSEFTNIQRISSGTCGDNLTWRLTEEYELIIEGTGEMYDFSSDSQPWTEYRESIQTIIIADGVTSIGAYAFYRCSSLTAINIPESVTSIGEGAFDVCSSLTAITIPGNSHLTSIGNYAFSNCSSLTAITIPESVTSIGKLAFSHCRSLTAITVAERNTVYDSRGRCNAIIEKNSNTLIAGCSATVIPEGVESIGYGAFNGHSDLIAITIPKSVTNFGYGAFANCRSLTSINIPESVTSIGAYAFYYCTSLTTITIPEGVTSIGEWTFLCCTSLKSITIPKSVTSIGYYAFFDCSSLTAITCNAITPPAVVSLTFYALDKSIPVYVPAGSVEAYKSAQYWSEFTNIQAILNEFTLTISAAGYATMFLDYAVAIPEGVEVFYASSVEGDRLKMTRVTGVLPANTGVIVRAAKGDYTFTEIEGEYDAIEGNLLMGTTTKTLITTESGYAYYVLANTEGVAMYKPMLNNGQFYNNANKAYLKFKVGNLGIFDDEVDTDEEGGQLSNRLRFDFGGTTSIQNSQFPIDNSQVIYDLRGCKVTDTEGLKGIYIVNGRKVVIK